MQHLTYLKRQLYSVHWMMSVIQNEDRCRKKREKLQSVSVMTEGKIMERVQSKLLDDSDVDVEMFNSGYNGETKKSPKIRQTDVERVEKTPENSFRKLFKQFASDTTFGGVSKVTHSDGHMRRFLWFLISATCYGFTIYMCLLLVQTYLDKPIKTAVDIVYEKNIDFPAVTVCNLNQFRHSEIKHLGDIRKILHSYSDEKRNKSDGSSFEDSVSRQGNHLKKDISNDLDDDEKDFSDVEVDEDVLVEQLVAIEISYYNESELREVGHQLDDMFLSCSWKGLDCSSGYFTKFLTRSWNWKYGNCYTFNPGGNETGHMLPVFRTSKPGPNYGLSLDINIEQDEYVNELSDEAGALIVIHNARQMPFPYDEGITVPPGFSSSIAIRKESITRVDPFNNGSCNPSPTLSSENIFRTYMGGSSKKYSTKACMESCLAVAQQKACNCSEAKFAGYVKRICHTSADLDCMGTVTQQFRNSKLNCDNRCPQPCEHHSYRYTVMTSSLTSKEKETRKNKDFKGKNHSNFDFDDNFLRVKIFYDELNLQKIVQSTYYDLQTLLGDIGGQLGLWIGVCVISVAEFGELLISLCVVGARKSRDRNKTKTSEIELT